MDNLMEKLQEAASYIASKIGEEPVQIGMVLGSGLGELADVIQDPVYIPYKDIPHFPVSTVSGHKSRLVVGNLEGKRVLCMQGRFHYYEGYGMDQVVFPIQTMHILKIKNLLLTNAAGCVNESWKPGDLMLISDHIKLIADNPLRGMNQDALGERFFDMSTAYDKTLRQIAKKCGKDLGLDLKEGIYQLFTGPSFETPAEVRFARLCGADAVGMSTVPEAIVASHMRMKVLGISCLTNMAAGILEQPLDHREVLETGEKAKESFSALVRSITKVWPL
ncbi:purine-nucleoside phosphorylase [uncultured Sphaerochaeta sp.]|uniref:purine-nucleoside phosphorylase n=1 Tax=uncultured Sphaerochaeta sp. TaxID=886478 RepID=UPI002A0A3163|nr:purine-nucleoside phosphorylase [uncultured Sphaerochaeta sp.]